MDNSNTTISSVDALRFIELEIAKNILEIADGESGDKLRQIQSNVIESVERFKPEEPLFSSEKELLDYLSDLDELPSVEDLIETLNIIGLGDHLYRIDYDINTFIYMDSKHLAKLLDISTRKASSLFKEIKKSDIRIFLPHEVESRYKLSSLQRYDRPLSKLDELLQMLTSDEDTKFLLTQILLSVAFDYRFDRNLIVVSGSKTRLEVLRSILDLTTDDRVVSAKTSNYKAFSESAEYQSAKVVWFEDKTSKLGSEIDSVTASKHFVPFVESHNFNSPDCKYVELKLDASRVDDSSKRSEFVANQLNLEPLLQELHSIESDYRLNRYKVADNVKSHELYEFMHFLRVNSIIGRAEIPTSLIYSLYLDYLKSHDMKSAYPTQAKFTAAVIEILSNEHYLVSSESVRLRSALAKSDFSDEFIKQLTEKTFYTKELLSSNKISKVLKLQEYSDDDLKPVEERLHKVSKLRARMDSSKLVETVHEKYRGSIEDLSLALYDMLDRSILHSAFLTYELVKFVARNAFLDCRVDLDSDAEFDLTKLECQLNDVKEIVHLDLSKSSKICLINNCLEKIDMIEDSFQRAIDLDKFDDVLCELLKTKQDFRAARLVEDFSNAVNTNRKSKIRKSMIESVCENL